MKKVPKLFLSTLTLSLIFAPLFPERARAASYGSSSWTVPELLEYKTTIDEERNALCGNDEDCSNNYYERKFAEDGSKYRALNIFKSYQLIPTEFDFDAGTIKILLFDENMKASSFPRAPKSDIIVKDLAIWLSSENILEASSSSPIGKILNGEVPGMQPLFGFTRSEPMELVKNKETEYPMLANSRNMADYKYPRIKLSFSSNFFNFSANVSFSGCSYASNFPHGKCILTVSDRDFSYRFIKTPEDTAPTIEDENPTPPINPTEDEDIPEQPSTGNQEDILPIPSATDDNLATPTIGLIPKAPDTGIIAPSPTCQRVIEFPWWLAGLIVVADVTLLWLFWPKNKNTRKSNH